MISTVFSAGDDLLVILMALVIIGAPITAIALVVRASRRRQTRIYTPWLEHKDEAPK